MAYIVAGTAITPFHGDESTLIYMSRDYDYQFIQRDLSLIRYSDPPMSAQEQELRLLNGTLIKNLIGLSWHAAGFSIDDLNEQWDWGADWNYNQSTGHAPSESLLQAARIPSAALLALGVIPMFIIGYYAGGWVGAFAASGLYAVHPALLVNGRRAMMEGSLIAFSLLTVCAGIWFMRARSWFTAVALGLAAGLALASKHTAVFTVGGVFGACFLVVLMPSPPTPLRQPRGVKTVMQLAVGGLVAVGVFLLMNPAWWGEPIRAAMDVLRLRSDLLAGQTAAFGGYADYGNAFSGFLRQSFGWTPQYYEIPAWAGYIGDQIIRYESSGLAGVITGAWGVWVTLILSVIGAVMLVRRTETAFGVRVLIGAWALAMFGSTLLLTPLEWGRYYLPAVLAVMVLVSAGIAGFVAWVKRG